MRSFEYTPTQTAKFNVSQNDISYRVGDMTLDQLQQLELNSAAGFGLTNTPTLTNLPQNLQINSSFSGT